MASRIARASVFALALSVRAVLIGGLAWGAIELVMRAHYYATALVLTGLATIVAVDLARSVTVADRMLKTFADGLAAGAVDRPARPNQAFGALNAAMDRAANTIESERSGRQGQIDSLEALLDTVSAALLVLSPDGAIDFANRGARALGVEVGHRLEKVPAIGAEAAARLLALAPGARDIVRLADGRQMLAAITSFTYPTGGRRRFVSLQSVSGDLDLVELKAWQDLVRILAHEMMNSLTPVVSLAESLDRMLRDRGGKGLTAAVAKEAAGAVQVIARRSESLMSFVDRYRRVAELPVPELGVVRLAELTANLGKLIEPMLKERGVAFSSQANPPDLTLRADAELLEQAVLNLLKNAVEAVDGVADPAIELAVRSAADGAVVVSVTDNGRGLPDDVDGLFVPFFTTKAGGSGIGLSIARQVALAHQGRAIAERGPSGGAVFSLVFPVGR